MKDKIMLSVIIPFYDEEENLPILTEELCNAVKRINNCNAEFIYVNDGSNDDSEKLLLESIKSVENIQFRIINLEYNCGLSSALWAGIQNSQGDIVITIDSDLQNDPADIPEMVDIIVNTGVDAVIGIRANRKDTFVKRMTSKSANAIRNFLIKDGVKDTGCTLKAFTGKAVKSLPFFKGMHRFLPFLLKLKGYTFKTLDVNHRERKYGEPKYFLFNRLIGPFCDLLAAIWMRNRNIHYKIKDEKIK
ncbi:glycosyltransferase family 2 protein [bacterium]|nr:glycosyltransferase family 2 protein [bacterium]